LQNEKFLSSEEEKTLLKLARTVLENFVSRRQRRFAEKDLEGMNLTPSLKKPFGVFVTLTEKDRLRGCIGHIVPVLPLYQGVIENAMNSAANDPRFSPVDPQELKNIHIEISVMSPLMEVASPDEIMVGRDGLVLTNGRNSGVFLPQVPVEWHWDKQTYLEELGQKAGLDKGAYKRPGIQLKRFTAQVFGEE
jgi:AmmeMemoRadiSam system protein A